VQGQQEQKEQKEQQGQQEQTLFPLLQLLLVPLPLRFPPFQVPQHQLVGYQCHQQGVRILLQVLVVLPDYLHSSHPHHPNSEMVRQLIQMELK
jgi:hypothetical protein